MRKFERKNEIGSISSKRSDYYVVNVKSVQRLQSNRSSFSVHDYRQMALNSTMVQLNG